MSDLKILETFSFMRFLVGTRGGASIMPCLIIWNVVIGGLDSKGQMAGQL
jgi:hypothetical protein